jgi:hypothetical protein
MFSERQQCSYISNKIAIMVLYFSARDGDWETEAAFRGEGDVLVDSLQKQEGRHARRLSWIVDPGNLEG